MENVSEALGLAGNILIFLLAVSLAIFSFNQVRATADTIISYKDRETVYIDGDFYYEPTGNTRQVGLETIIPAIYRSYEEKYRIVFKEGNDEIELYKNKLTLNKGTDIGMYSDFTFGNKEKQKEGIEALLYGRENDKYQIGINETNDGLCKYIKDKYSEGKIVIEHLGVYATNDTEEIEESNKEEIRIITYEITNKIST